jgi:hypothetical protein
MRGRVHIFKYLENMASKDALPSHKRVEDTKRSVKHSSYINNSPNPSGAHQITSGNATIDCLRHKPRHVVDSGYCTDGVEKRWSNDGEYTFYYSKIGVRLTAHGIHLQFDIDGNALEIRAVQSPKYIV